MGGERLELGLAVRVATECSIEELGEAVPIVDLGGIHLMESVGGGQSHLVAGDPNGHRSGDLTPLGPLVATVHQHLSARPIGIEGVDEHLDVSRPLRREGLLRPCHHARLEPAMEGIDFQDCDTRPFVVHCSHTDVAIEPEPREPVCRVGICSIPTPAIPAAHLPVEAERGGRLRPHQQLSDGLEVLISSIAAVDDEHPVMIVAPVDSGSGQPTRSAGTVG